MFSGLAVLLAVTIFVALGAGSVQVGPMQAVAIILDELGIHLTINYETLQKTILLTRLPRTAMGLLVGAALGVCGAALQSMFRSPLADPSLMGISSGAALGVTLLSSLGLSGLVGGFTLPLAAFCGAVFATLLVYRLATSGGRTSVITLLLAGIAINALCGAGIGLLSYITGGSITGAQDILFWSLGGLDRATWSKILAALPFVVLSVGGLWMLARPLNALLLGESEAGHLGVDVERAKQIIAALVAVGVGTGTAAAGIIAFVALIVPHLLRSILGPDHRRLLPAAALLGASLVTGADVIARTVVYPVPLPIGLITSLVGGPFFLYLMQRDRVVAG